MAADGPIDKADLRKLVEEQVSSVAGNGDRGKKTIRPTEFWWDQFIKYIAAVMALGTVLDSTLQQLFGTGGPVCFVPASRVNNSFEITRDDVVYINTFCEQSLSRAQYYPFFVLVQGILLATPHYVWGALFVGDFDYFFSVALDLNRFRDRKTGHYKAENFYIINKLEEKYKESYQIFVGYIVKLSVQFAIGVAAIVVNESVFDIKYFNFNFKCQSGSHEGWGFSFTKIPCVISSFSLYERVKWINLALLCLVLLVLLCGILWCSMRHAEALGSDIVAEFATNFCLDAKFYVPSHLVPCGKPLIRNDLDFLLMRLYRADPGHGDVFKSLQVGKEITTRIEQGDEKAITTGIEQGDENNIGLEIRTGPHWYSLKLAKKYKKVLSVHFDPFYEGEPRKERIQNTCTIQVQWNYTSQTKKYQNNCKKLLYADFPPRASHPPEKLINFVIIAPVTDPSESITVRRFLEEIAGYTLAKECKIVYIRPEKIGHKNVFNLFTSLNLDKEKSFQRVNDIRSTVTTITGVLGGETKEGKDDVIILTTEVGMKCLFQISIFELK